MHQLPLEIGLRIDRCSVWRNIANYWCSSHEQVQSWNYIRYLSGRNHPFSTLSFTTTHSMSNPNTPKPILSSLAMHTHILHYFITSQLNHCAFSFSNGPSVIYLKKHIYLPPKYENSCVSCCKSKTSYVYEYTFSNERKRIYALIQRGSDEYTPSISRGKVANCLFYDWHKIFKVCYLTRILATVCRYLNKRSV